MREISLYHAKNDLVMSGYVPCARNITSGNLFCNKNHVKFDVVAPLVSAKTIVAVGDKENTFGIESDMPFGECFALSAGCDVIGVDYLGQVVKETLASSGTTKKAFKKVLHVKLSAAAGSAVTINTAKKVGVPFQTAAIDTFMVNGVAGVKTSGESPADLVTLTNFTQTQSATSNDPRGILDMSACTAGDEVECVLTVTEFCTKDANGKDVKGGLFGAPHYAG